MTPANVGMMSMALTSAMHALVDMGRKSHRFAAASKHVEHLQRDLLLCLAGEMSEQELREGVDSLARYWEGALKACESGLCTGEKDVVDRLRFAFTALRAVMAKA